MATLNGIQAAPGRYRALLGPEILLRGAVPPLNPLANRAALLLVLEEAGSPLVGTQPDAALTTLLRETVDDLLLPGNEARLGSVLRYHAIASQVQARREARLAKRPVP